MDMDTYPGKGQSQPPQQLLQLRPERSFRWNSINCFNAFMTVTLIKIAYTCRKASPRHTTTCFV